MQKVSKIISGGQTGADFGGLLFGRAFGIATGGTAPKGWRTERGPNPVLADFGLEQSTLADYPTRTRRNVENSDLTIIFNDKNTPGTQCTVNACKKLRRPYIVVDPNNEQTPEIVRLIIIRTFDECNRPIVINVAGSRESKFPGIEQKTVEILTKVFTNLNHNNDEAIKRPS